MASDISDLFTDAVRDLMEAASMKQIGVCFDYRGPRATASHRPDDLLRGIRRVLACSIDVLAAGNVVFDAECLRTPSGRCRLRIEATGTGTLVERTAQARHLDALLAGGMRSSAGSAGSHALHGSGHCPISGGTINFISQLGEGAQITLQIDTLDPMPDDPPRRGALVHSSNAIAWLIHDHSAIAASLPRRLNRLGWTTIQFRSPQEACVRLTTRPSSTLMPSLVIVTESALHTAEHVRALRRMLAPWTRGVIAVSEGPAAMKRREPINGYEVLQHPLSPAELDELTGWFAGSDSSPSYHQFSIPLHMIDRPRMLIVDANAIDRVVATGMAQCLGHAVETARDGRAAIDKCLGLPPAVILMSLDMPQLNGLDATRQIRALQRNGALPPCSILGTTACSDAEVRDACLAAGMDGVLLKPLFMAPLQEELRRICSDGARVR